MDRIVFFSKEDLMSNSMMRKINELFGSNHHLKHLGSINDILQLHHICEYIDNGFTYEEWDNEKTKEYNLRIKEFKKEINLYYKNLTAREIVEFYDDIEFDYYESFWMLTNRFETYKVISREDLYLLFQKERFNIDYLLYCSRIVAFFDQEIRNYLVSKEDNAENLLNYFEASHDRKQKEKFFPKSLTLADREDLISRYLDTVKANLNYVRLAEKNKDSEFLKISDKTRLKAKRLSKRLNEEFFNRGTATKYGIGARLCSIQEEVEKIVVENGSQIFSYSEKQLILNTDKITLFKNFKKVFGFIDFQGCIDLVSKSAAIDTLENIFMRSKNEFQVSIYFQNQMVGGAIKFEFYKRFLKSLDMTVEDLLQHYVNDHLNNAYKVDTFKLYLPSSSGTTLEKIRLIVPEFESLIEQFKLYAEDGHIDFELLQVTTKTSGYEKIPSLIKRKYVYPRGEEFQKLTYNFFSRSSFLFDNKKYGKKYSCFYHLIISDNIGMMDFEDVRRDYLQRFIDENHLRIDQGGFIKPVNEISSAMIGILHQHDVLSYWHYPRIIRDEIDKMEKQKLVSFSGALFTKAERDYFNYYLNNRYSNGLWLRNKYVHATNTHDDQEQQRDYDELLKLLVLLVLKIEVDLNIAQNMPDAKAAAQ